MIEKIYKRTNDRDLKLLIHNPHNQLRNRTAILFFHGGSYVKSDRDYLAFKHHAELYASKGIVSICVDYRTANDTIGFSPLNAISDAQSAISFIRKHHMEFGINPNKVVMCGASSGGFTVLCSILSNEIKQLDAGSENTMPNAMIMFNPGVDGIEVINRLFPTLSDQAEKLSPLHNIKPKLPPLIWFIGTADVIYDSNVEFYKKWVDEGNQCDFFTYDAMPHGFFNYGQYGNKPFQMTNQKIEKFLHSLQFV
ncbi:alpha/beta hydrolase [Aquibacillus kalidii]|uniref:alpha/beta hydrolase n=1 Tax=Aquibacillus kalidii TaxID=2762597 RepID=UPI001C99CB7E|nr:alpha/beta hydrolase [Aquibacillus kalidii]